MNKNQKRWKENHLKALEVLGFKASQFNRLRFLENRANHWAVKYANGDIDGNDFEAVRFDVEQAIKKLHDGTLPKGFFVNSDPRGYALKIDNEKTEIPQGLYTDWGGYGILAPSEF